MPLGDDPTPGRDARPELLPAPLPALPEPGTLEPPPTPPELEALASAPPPTPPEAEVPAAEPPPAPPEAEAPAAEPPPAAPAQAVAPRSRLARGAEGLLLAGVTLPALLPRLACLDCHSLWRDEIAVLEGLGGGLSAVAQSNVPLYTFQVWLASQIADPTTTAAWLRLPSALAGALTPLVIYALGRAWWGRAEGLLAALLTALAPVLLVYAHDMRSYAELTLLAAVAVAALVWADRTGAVRWLLAAGGALGAALLLSRTVVVMILPAVTPFAIAVLARWWRRRGRHTPGGRLASGLLIGAAVLGAGLLAGQWARLVGYITPFTLPDLGPAALGTFQHIVTQQVAFAIPAAFAGPGTEWARTALLGLIGLGAAAGLLRRGARQGVVVCGLLIVIPLVVLTVGSSVNIIYPRFALFALPFGFLLAAHGLVAPLRALRPSGAPGWWRGAVAGAGALGAAALLLPFALGTEAYFLPGGNTQLTYRPDYRAVTQYLTARVQPHDVILFVGWDDRVADFYWHARPPAASYSALDPRLYRHRGAGSVYWVVSYDYNAPTQLVQSRPWAAVLEVQRLVVLREDSPNREMHQLMTDFTGRMFDNGPLDPVLARSLPIMRGASLQGRGFINEAVLTYRTVGSDAPTRAFGREWIQVAADQAAAGVHRPAWRAALMAQYHQPDAPPVYRQLAALLAGAGLPRESNWATAVAEALEAPP